MNRTRAEAATGRMSTWLVALCLAWGIGPSAWAQKDAGGRGGNPGKGGGQDHRNQKGESATERWEKVAGQIFDKYDRNHDGFWEPKEWRPGTPAIEGVIGGMRMANMQLETRLQSMPRAMGGNGRDGGGGGQGGKPGERRGQGYKERGGDSAQADAGSATTDGPDRRIAKDSFVRQYGQMMAQLETYNMQLASAIQAAHQANMKSGGRGGRGGK